MKMLLQLLTLTALITQDIFLKYCNFHNSNKVNYFKVTVCLLKWILSLDWVKTWSVSGKQPERREREKKLTSLHVHISSESLPFSDDLGPRASFPTPL